MNACAHVFVVDVKSADIDFMGHVNNATYLIWVQSAVISHWRSVADAEAVAAHVWVAIKHEITYRKPAFLDDRVVVTVTLEAVRRESAFYETVITRDADILAHVTSRWCCLNARTLRPVRLGDAVVERFFGLRGSAKPVAADARDRTLAREP